MSVPTVVIGIDPSSKKIAAVITVNGSDLVTWTRTLPDSPIDVKADWAERHTRRMAHTYCLKGYRVIAFVEDPVVGRGGAYATIAQATVRGAILVGLRRAGVIEVHGVNNQRWKKVVVGKGNVNKTQIKRHVYDTWPALWELSAGDEDLCDAGCINAYGEQVLRLEKRISTYRETE